jgi:phospholipid/cholesterol/gamma-HCH transport system permease protein
MTPALPFRIASHDGSVPGTVSRAGRDWLVSFDKGSARVVLVGDWAAAFPGVEPGAAARLLDHPDLRSVGFDASGLGRWDSSLLVFLSGLRQASTQRNVHFDETGLPLSARRLLALLPREASPAAASVPRPAILRRIGASAIARWSALVAVTTLVGEVVLRTGTALRGRARMRRVDLVACMTDAGILALPIVAIVNVLIGCILAFVGAVQLRRFGANVYVANLVGVGVVREMAPLMTAIVMSGRTGGAYAAQIASMQGSEEIDALRAIGIPIYDYLLLPRIFALSVMMPLLFLYGSVIGILGGLAVAVPMLGVSPEGFVAQARAALSGTEILFGLTKSIAFGALIAIAGCQTGMRAGRSAADVGRAATSAVVVGIVGVIALDALFAVCANMLGI